MASPAGLRPIWHTLKRTQMPTPTLLCNSRSFASQKPPQDGNRHSSESAAQKSGYKTRDNKLGTGLRQRRARTGAELSYLDVIPPKHYLYDPYSNNTSNDPTSTHGNLKYPDGSERPNRLPRAILEKMPGSGVSYPEPRTDLPQVRLPRSVQAVYLRPLRREAQYGVPCCDLQMRSYSVRNLEFFADFALRAAYYLHLPAYGPVPLPRITQRWTVPKSNFVFKKSQENFERVTVRRLIQIKDGHPETVELWLAFLRKHQYHGVGMKANVWEYEKIGVGKEMDVKLGKVADEMATEWGNFGRQHSVQTAEKVVELMNSEKFRQATGS